MDIYYNKAAMYCAKASCLCFFAAFAVKGACPKAQKGLPMENKRKKRSIIIVSVVLAILLILGASSFILYSMLTNRDQENKLRHTASTDIFAPLAQSVILGTEQDITDQQINSILAYAMENIKSQPAKSSDAAVKKLALYLHEDYVEIFADLDYKSVPMIFSGSAQVELNPEDNTINFTLTETSIGTLSIPPNWVMSMLNSRNTFRNMPTEITIDETCISVPASYELNVMEMDLTLDITELTPMDGYAKIKTAGLANQFSDSLGDFISGFFE